MSLKEKLSVQASIYPVSSSSSLTDVARDAEKCESSIALDESSLATYVVPVLEKGVKTALKKPTSGWVRFRVWYNPYRMVRPFLFTSRK